MQEKIYFSVITPAFNREQYLPKLVSSLQNQSKKNFEWIIANDGSSDNTIEYIQGVINDLDFPVKFISSDRRIGKSMIDNILLDNVRGEFILMCDSDDYFEVNAMEKLTNVIESNAFTKSLSGVIGQNLNTLGVSQTFNVKKKLPESKEYSWSELEKILIGDGTICVRSSLFEGKRFPEVDFLSHESVLLRELYKHTRFILITDVLKIMDRTAENSITHGKKIEYTRGSAYAITQTITVEKFGEFSLKDRFLKMLNYFRYSIHADISLKNSIKSWDVFKKYPYFCIVYPISLLISMRDVLMKKVIKTHKEFDKNRLEFKLTETHNDYFKDSK